MLSFIRRHTSFSPQMMDSGMTRTSQAEVWCMKYYDLTVCGHLGDTECWVWSGVWCKIVGCGNIFVSKPLLLLCSVCAPPDTFLERATIGKWRDSRTLYLCFCQQSGECPGFRDTSTCISVSLLYITFIFYRTYRRLWRMRLAASSIVLLWFRYNI